MAAEDDLEKATIKFYSEPNTSVFVSVLSELLN